MTIPAGYVSYVPLNSLKWSPSQIYAIDLKFDKCFDLFIVVNNINYIIISCTKLSKLFLDMLDS